MGTTFNVDIYIPREIIESVSQIETLMDDAKCQIQTSKERLLMLIMLGSAKEFNTANINAIHLEVNSLVDYICEKQDELTQLELVKEKMNG